ncbi:MAG TPA: isoleucine--tRNA ligase, partial [Solirubrobacteraceae bacterium]|nr:isoleucine--tRNA ligase [Solirubrobacteraceae bacterium]
RESVFMFLEDWNALTERIGFWVDLDHAYRTLDSTYIESVWSSLKRIADEGMLYEGHKVVPYCPRCGTALSSHEVASGYQDVEDPSVYVRLKVGQDGGPLQAGDELLIWTTTPWTLVSNAAVAVDPELVYVRAKTGRLDPPVVLAEALVERVLGDPAGVQILERFPGAAIDGVRYEPPFPFLSSDEYGERGHSVLLADFVSAQDGTGLVHTAIAFGEDDYRLGAQYGLKVVNPVRLDGTYDERIGSYAGRFVKDADGDLVEDLRARGRLLRSERLMHSYPHCWRCGTPLLYYAKPSWYIGTSKLRGELLAANEQVTWHPEHIKHGRFGKWLENNVDWALSRERYWGTPLPVWRCGEGHVTIIGSFDELEDLSGVRLEDPHRPFADEVTFPCGECGEIATRVPEVIDVWFDSGAMPFAQRHEPFESGAGLARLEELYSADFICEALDQTRGWFYSLLSVSTLLRGPEVPYRNVVCLGLLLDEEGQKMSKTKGNVVAPNEVIDRFGADALRWYFFTSKQPWDGYLFSLEAIGEGVRLFLRQLWNTYAFATLYTADATRAAAARNDLDSWIRSRLSATIATVTAHLDDYDATNGGRAIAEFVDDLSNWYVRRSRRRFWDGDVAAHETLRHCLVTVAQLLAPFVPFVADEIYDNLDGTEPSVHLCDWPRPEPRDEELELAMSIARETVRLGLAARGAAKLKIRQPLHEAVVVAADRERDAIERLAGVVREELNVKVVRFVSEAGELGSYTLKPNYRSLGPRFGKAMPQVAAAVAALEPAHVADALRAGGSVSIFLDGHDHELDPEDLQVALAPLEGYQLEREGSHAVALELTLDDALRREGLAREVVHAVQSARRDAGLQISDRIVLRLGGDDELLAAARKHELYLSGEVLAVEVHYDADGVGDEALIEGRELRISVARAG